VLGDDGTKEQLVDPRADLPEVHLDQLIEDAMRRHRRTTGGRSLSR
jgi:hypothetical protein